MFFYKDAVALLEAIANAREETFQSPEGDSLFFYEEYVFQTGPDGWPVDRLLRFSPPKGIHCFSTVITHETLSPSARVFQSPEGDSLFFYSPLATRCYNAILEFQSPEGDALFFYRCPRHCSTTSVRL